jgi:membrane protease YdiL (CAAX protease family)
MTDDLRKGPSFWTTLRLLLGAARKRAAGRRRRQQELFQNRSDNSGQPASDWGGIGTAITVLVMAGLNVAGPFLLTMSVESGQRLQAQNSGKIVVSPHFLNVVQDPRPTYPALNGAFESEARRIAERYGGNPVEIEKSLRDEDRKNGSRNFINSHDAAPGLGDLARSGRAPQLLGSLVLMAWLVMLIFQGEGLEIDLQRRRHPMWEWIFTHPVHSAPVFLAEMLSPIAANPIYWSGPLFVGFLYGFVYGPAPGAWAGILIGIPVTIAAACLGKALEIAVVLRFSPRTRGAVIGIMGWLGYVSMMFLFIGLLFIPKLVTATQKVIFLLIAVPWPWLRLFLGARVDGSFSFASGLFACWTAAFAATAAAIWFSVWGANRGLSGNFAAVDLGPSSSRKEGTTQFGKEPLYRKEFLWFIRDRSAIVQTILIPITVAGIQVFNLRGMLAHAQDAWNYLCGVGILFGTYFLWVLGPKSLASEGSALWISLTWPRGLESLLKAKAWLWSMISTALVALVLCYAAFLFPTEIWKIALVGVGWFLFGRSMAEKTVTLVTVTSPSGEREKIPRGRQWAAQLGMLTFCIGVLTQQWNLAIVGIVYSYVTAAAMWQNFRARLPYLYDPWSETLPKPPTLMHAMVAISILIECGAIVTGILAAAMGRQNIAAAQALGYAICAAVVSVATASFLSDRGVTARDVWYWEPFSPVKPGSWWAFWRSKTTGHGKGKFILSLVPGVIGGMALGLFAFAYVTVLHHIPFTAEILRKSQEEMSKIPDLKIWFSIMAIAFAPFAEEYLFRGLLFRALDREWGGWRAVLGSAAFFAIYHSPFSWLPVGLVGAANALLFKKTGRLAPAVVLHMVYNAIVVIVGW